MKKRRCRVSFIILFLVSAVVFAAAGCSIKKLAMKSVADMMSGLVSGMVDARYTVPMGAVMNIMLENGLKKKEVPAEAVSEWRELFEQGFRSLAGKVFPLETYENVEDYLTAYRSR